MKKHRNDLEDAVEAGFNDPREVADPGPSNVEGSDTLEAADAPPEITDLSLAEQQRDEYKERLLRKTAEFDNFRKRTERERQNVEETAAFNIIHELLPLVDNLERALGVEPGTEGSEAYRKGVELIYRELQEILRRRGVKPIEALGAQFDPHYHQAVSYEPADDRSDGEIVEEFRRGYMLGDRLLRPSMVKVAKG